MLIEMKKKTESKETERDIQETLLKENACYVLITCGQPSEDGKMQVEMTYEGDAYWSYWRNTTINSYNTRRSRTLHL